MRLAWPEVLVIDTASNVNTVFTIVSTALFSCSVPPPTTDTITKGIPNETNIIIYVMCGVLVILFGLAVVLVLYYHCYNGKGWCLLFSFYIFTWNNPCINQYQYYIPCGLFRDYIFTDWRKMSHSLSINMLFCYIENLHFHTNTNMY